MSSFEPSEGADEMESCEEVAGGFFITGCDTSEVLDGIEEALDEIALGIKCEVAIALDLSV